MKGLGRCAKALLHFQAQSVHRKFQRSLIEPHIAQQEVLKRILNLTSKNALPIEPTVYSSYAEGHSWTKESVRFFELTSGSSGVRKKIPYTKALLKSFENMFLLWADDVLNHFDFETGKIFISFSPQLKSMGMQSDVEYLSPFLRKVLNPFFSVEASSFKAENGDEFLKKLANKLVLDENLEIISIWSPTYFLSLLDFAKNLDLSHDPLLQKAVTKGDWGQVWPKLKLISTWADGSSEPRYRALKEQFSHVVFQPKGLLATEAPMTVPLCRVTKGSVPLWTETYLEYVDDRGDVRNLHEMEVGESGELVISTTGGLLRYRIGDLIECTDRILNSPVVRFLRRTGEVSDLVGEKLDSDILRNLLPEQDWGYWTLVASGNRYLFISDRPVNPRELDERLCKSYHYALARELRQLEPVVVSLQPRLREKYFAFCESLGMQKGDVKDRLLWSDERFSDYLKIQE